MVEGYKSRKNYYKRKGWRSNELTMESCLKEVLHMKEGISECSYARSSYIQKQALLSTKSIKEEAINELYCKQRPSVFCIADLGCSSAADNSLHVIFELMETVEKARHKLGHGPVDYLVYLNDLPRNDFNTLFKSLPNLDEYLLHKMGDGFGHCFVNAVPGSFYKRLFPNNSLHFVHSSYSLQWLSQEVEGVENNKGNIYVSVLSPPNVIEAYYEQFQKDFSAFLHCRSKELVPGGRMVLTLVGRNSLEPYSKECCYMWDLLAQALNDMVLEGFIEEKTLSTFNIPNYYPSASELASLVKVEGSFALNQVHISEANWKPDEYGNDLSKTSGMYEFVKCMRSVTESLLIKHFGELVIDEIFQRYEEIVHTSIAKEKNAFISITLSLTKRNMMARDKVYPVSY